jgi:hypothetical protein
MIAGDRYQNGIFVTRQIWGDDDADSDETDAHRQRSRDAVEIRLVEQAFEDFGVTLLTPPIDALVFRVFGRASFAIGKATSSANFVEGVASDHQCCAVLFYLEEFVHEVDNLLEHSLIEVQEERYEKDAHYYEIQDAAESLRQIVLKCAGLTDSQLTIYRNARSAFDWNRLPHNEGISEEENLDNFFEYFDGFYRDSRDLRGGGDD